MLYFTYGNLFILIFCFQSEAFLFTLKPPCDVSVSECMNCERVGFFPTMFCPQIEYGEFCYTKVVHNDSGIFTIKGHASKSFCEANNYKTSILNPSCKTGNLPKGTECIDCCKQYSCHPEDLYCNKNIIKPEHMPFTVTTIRTTPPTTVSSTTTTPQPTTPLPTTTQAPDEGLCQVCVESDGQNCDTSSSNQYCSQQKKYCMNTIISDPKGGMIVLKRCADEVECKWNYWVDTRGDPKCNNVTGPQADNACSYCCDNSNGNLPCNRNTIPTQLSTFDNSQEKKQCMTGTSNTQYQLETCSPRTSYCLNTVRYDTTAKDPEMYVEKKCAYEGECKGEWWNKSRKRPECLTQNFTGIADNNVICTYCCVSDGSGPCNGASVPEQIAHFEPVTTASTPTTATTLPTTAHGHGHHNTHVHTDHGHHHTVTTTQTTTERTTTTATLPSTTQSIHTSTTSPSTTAQTTATTLPSTTSTTATTMPTSTTTPAPIVCSGNTSIVCEDDPLAHCATLLSVGLCQKLQYNPDREDIKFCPKTCNLCDKYCEYILKPRQPPTTTPAPTHQMTTNATTIKPLTTTNKASTTSPTANITTNTTAGTTSSNPTTKATNSFIPKSTVTTTNKDQRTTATMSTTSTNPTTTATTATTTTATTATTTTGTTATTTTGTTTSTTTSTNTATTATILTTTTAAHPECYICTGPVTLCENLYAPQGCTSDKPFCINEVNNNSDGTRTVARRCASKTECIQNWWLGSSSRSECAGFDPTSPTLDQFSCSFCCTTPLCNKNIVPQGRFCKVCGDSDSNIPCDTRTIFLGDSVECPAGQDFCMTDIIHDSSNNEMIYKRCVDEATCRNEWLSQTSDQDHCTGYPNVVATGAYSCHFCCTSDSCNSGLLPKNSTLYTKARYRF